MRLFDAFLEDYLNPERGSIDQRVQLTWINQPYDGNHFRLVFHSSYIMINYEISGEHYFEWYQGSNALQNWQIFLKEKMPTLVSRINQK